MFSYMAVFMAGAMIFGQVHASTVVVSMSSAMPLASLAMTLAVAGAISTRSATLASEMCWVLNSKLRSNVSTQTRFSLSVSKVSGVMNSHAFLVMTTWTL